MTRLSFPAAWLAAVFLALVLLFFAGIVPAHAAAPSFRYSSVEEAKALALDCLMTCGFSVEYGNDGTANGSHPLLRWADTIYIYVGGSPAAEDLNELDVFLLELATHCPNMPNIHRVTDRSSANICIYYCPLNEMGYYLTNYTEGNWGYFSYWNNSSGEIYQAEIAIATDVNTRQSKNHLLREELVGAFGLTNDHSSYSDSILYSEWTTTPQLSDLDWLMLNMLYDPDLSPNTSSTDAYRILKDKIWQ